MRILRFTIKRGEVDLLIHNLQALKKHYDKGTGIACNLLQSDDNVGWVKKFFRIKERVKVIVQIDRPIPQVKNDKPL